MPYVSDCLTEKSRKDGVKEIVANSFVTLGDPTSALRVGTDLSSRTQVNSYDNTSKIKIRTFMRIKSL